MGIHINLNNSYNTIRSNNISNNGCGIYLMTTNTYNVIENNEMRYNVWAWHGTGGINNTIRNNDMSNNGVWGIYLNNSNDTYYENSEAYNTPFPFLSINGASNNTVVNLSTNTGKISFTGKDFSIGVASPVPADPSGYRNISKYVNASNNSADSSIFLNVSYDDSDVLGLNESSLRMWGYNGSSWSQVTGVNDADTAGNYVYSNITSFSIFAPLGVAPPNIILVSPVDGGLPQVAPGEEVLLVANSIGYALAKDFIVYLKSIRIEPTVINASEFTSVMKVENRFIIILGGPDAPEGVGQIVGGALSDSEVVSVRSAGAQLMFVKYNVWTNRWSYNQKVIFVAGSDRANTQAAETKYNSDVKSEVLKS